MENKMTNLRELYLLTFAILFLVSFLAMAGQDTGYNNNFQATVRINNQTFICDTVAVWQSREEVEVTDCRGVSIP